MLSRLKVANFRCLRDFAMECQEDLNILVGNNAAGKSTVLEALLLVLTKRLGNRYVESDISPHLFNTQVCADFVAQVQAGHNPMPPAICIEAYFRDADKLQELKGTNNSLRSDCPGIQLTISFDPDYADDYQRLLTDRASFASVPVEYYRATWQTFAGNPVSSRTLRVAASFIDATALRIESGADYYLQSILNEALTAAQRASLSIAYRRLKEEFSSEPALQELNRVLEGGGITDRRIAIGLESSRRGGWEASIAPHLDAIPLPFVGKGEQSAVKTLLALQRQAVESHVILIEEPENHLSYSSMAALIRRVQERCLGKQLFLTTHSAYVLNRLGMEHLVLMGENGSVAYLRNLSAQTVSYFRKLSGYDTLRVLLARKAILVEGPSDDLIVQKAYFEHHGRLPLQDGVDVIAVGGVAFPRFLDIASALNLHVGVVADNDGDYEGRVEERLLAYQSCPTIRVCASKDNTLPSLENQILACNDHEVILRVLKRSAESPSRTLRYMSLNKTTWALALFDSTEEVTYPQYIVDAVA
jgi:putative ATP-dependent endonuclease of the OLD family